MLSSWSCATSLDCNFLCRFALIQTFGVGEAMSIIAANTNVLSVLNVELVSMIMIYTLSPVRNFCLCQNFGWIFCFSFSLIENQKEQLVNMKLGPNLCFRPKFLCNPSLAQRMYLDVSQNIWAFSYVETYFILQHGAITSKSYNSHVSIMLHYMIPLQELAVFSAIKPSLNYYG